MESQDPTHMEALAQGHAHQEDPDTDQRQKEALAAFTATLHSVGTNLEAPLRERAGIINSNANSLEKQEAELAAQGSKLAKQNESWEKMNDETREGLKEIGDVQNWAEMIERDLLVLESMMDEVEGDDDRMSVDRGGSDDGHGHGHDGLASGYENGTVDVEMNGNGNGNGNGNSNGNVNGEDIRNLKDKKKKRRSWFFWW